MALKKEKELPSGVSGEYWKIVSVQLDRIKLELTVKIALFKDKAASDIGKQAMGVSHSFSGIITKSQTEGDLVTAGYTMIKAQIAGEAPSVMSGKLLAYNDLKNAIDT